MTDPEAVTRALAPLLGLSLAAADRSVIATHLRIAHGMAQIVEAFPLPDDAEPLPVFHPSCRP